MISLFYVIQHRFSSISNQTVRIFLYKIYIIDEYLTYKQKTGWGANLVKDRGTALIEELTRVCCLWTAWQWQEGLRFIYSRMITFNSYVHHITRHFVDFMVTDSRMDTEPLTFLVALTTDVQLDLVSSVRINTATYFVFLCSRFHVK